MGSDNAIVHQQMDIASFMASHPDMAFDLGQHFSRCQPPELKEMNTDDRYAEIVCQGVKAYVERMPAVGILPLVKKMSPYPTLWRGLVRGFDQGLPSHLSNKSCDGRDVALLAEGLEIYPDLREVFKTHTRISGISVEVRRAEFPEDESGLVPSVRVITKDGNASFYIRVGRRFEAVGDLLSRQAEQVSGLLRRMFPEFSP